MSIIKSKYTDLKEWISNLSDVFGKEFIIVLTGAQWVIKGLVAGGGSSGLFGQSMNYIFRAMNVNAAKMTIYRAVAITPWSLKSLLGFTSDLFPIFGYHKKPYILMGLYLSIFACICITFIWPMHPGLYTFLAFCCFLMVAEIDLLSEACYAERLKASPSMGPSLMSYVWGGIFGSQLFSTGLTGILLSIMPPHLCYLIALPFIIPMIIPISKNYLGEAINNDTKDYCIKMDKDKLVNDRNLFLLSLILGGLSILQAVLGISGLSETTLFISSIIIAMILIICFSKMLPTYIFKIELFFYTTYVYYLH